MQAFQVVAEKLQGWWIALVALLPNAVVAALVMLLFAFAARLAGGVVSRVLRRVSSNRGVTDLLSKLAVLVVLATGAFVALGILGLDKTVTSMLAGAGIVGLAIGIAFQDAIANLISGVFLSIRKPLAVGELVDTNDYFGTVTEVNMGATLLQTPDGQTVIIPNKDVFQSPIVNYSRYPWRRVDLECGVTYGENLAEVREVAVKVGASVPGRDTSREPEVFFTGFGDSSIDFVLRFWIPYRTERDFFAARSEAILRLKAAFDAAGITIPFPIRTLDFSEVGGDRLESALSRWEPRALPPAP